MPEALLGVAQVLAEDDPENAGKALEQALKVNPNFIDGHLLVATQQIASEQYDKARGTIDKVLAVKPESTEAYSLLATIEYVRGNTDRFNQNVRKVLQLNPQDNELYYILADNSIKLRLYKEAVAFAKEALRLNPRDFKSENLLGVNLLRIGEEQAGREALERAWTGDKFNPWTKNTLTLLDSWALNFDRLESPHFNIKLHKKESAALKPYVVDLLEKAYKTLTAKYDFTPEGPLTFEMYPDHEDFAVRTLGLPG